MQPSADKTPTIAASFDGGTMDCGNGLLLLIRKHMDPLLPGQFLEIFSSEPSVQVDLPAWCRLTGNTLVSQSAEGSRARFVVAKKSPAGSARPNAVAPHAGVVRVASDEPRAAAPNNAPAHRTPSPLTIEPLACMGIGSWPRPKWLLRALHDHLEGRVDEDEFREAANDSVRLIVEMQKRAEVDVLTDGEQHRDDYASFVAQRLEHCQLVPVSDLLPYLEEPEEFARSLAALDVPADQVRFPAVTGPIARRRPLALNEFLFLRQLADRPCKVALPGPYLLTRTMWMECISDQAYASREELARDLVRVLREEIGELLEAGADLVQLDEPVLTEVVHGRPAIGNRTFMCGALGSKGPVAEELHFAQTLLSQVVQGFPPERLALHICRGNWTPDETAALSGGYEPLASLLSGLGVGTLFLEYCTPRAGELNVIAQLPSHVRVGVGVVNQKRPEVETSDQIVARAEAALQRIGTDRLLLTPDCGFATFADNPVTSSEIAFQKLRSIARARDELRLRHSL